MDIKLPKGTRDLSPEEKILRDKIISTLKNVFELYGYAPLETPILEKWDILASKYAGGAEILKETFKLKDQGGRELGLRYDLTVPLSRYIGANPSLKMPFKRYQIGEVFRDGPISSARYRQFTQCDVDVIGASSSATDADIIDLIHCAFSKLNLEVVIKINNRKLFNDILDHYGIEKSKQESVILTIDKLEKLGLTTVKNELKQQNIDTRKIDKIADIITIKGENIQKIQQLKKILGESNGLSEIEKLLEHLKNLNLDVDFSVSLSRGLSYYTGMVIEVFLKDDVIKSAVCAGGRYDNMIGSFLGKADYPAVGVSFGLDRIYDALDILTKNNGTKQKTKTQVYIIPIKTLHESTKVSFELRKAGINVDIDLMEKSITRNLEYANSLGIPYVVFIGKKELGQGKIKLRNMQSGLEEMIEVKEIVERLIKV